MSLEPDIAEHIEEPSTESGTQLAIQRAVLEATLAGRTIDDIAEAMGLPLAEAKDILKLGLDKLNKYNLTLRANLRDIEHRRIEVAVAGIWDKVQDGSLPAIGTFIKLAERKSKLWGLDAPEKVSVTDPTGEKEGGPRRIVVDFVDPDPHQWDDDDDE